MRVLTLALMIDGRSGTITHHTGMAHTPGTLVDLSRFNSFHRLNLNAEMP